MKGKYTSLLLYISPFLSLITHLFRGTIFIEDMEYIAENNYEMLAYSCKVMTYIQKVDILTLNNSLNMMRYLFASLPFMGCVLRIASNVEFLY